MQRLRTLPLKVAAGAVDVDNRIIRGVSMAQAVEALGHGGRLDMRSLEQLVEQVNAKRSGAKSRFTHPGLSSDGMGKFLGRMKNARIEGDKALADLHLSKLAFSSPDGNLGGYVLEAIDEDPEAFGFSVVISTERVWVLKDGTEVVAGDENRHPDAIDKLPAFRISDLHAVDLVDEPAANRDGMFSQFLWGSNVLAEETFAEFDAYVQQAGFTPAKVFEVALKYADARGVDLAGFKASERIEEMGKEAQQEAPVSREEFEALRQELAAQQAAAAEAKAREEQLAQALDESNKRNAEMARAATRKRYAEMSREWVGDSAKHVDTLEALASVDGENSAVFCFHVETQNAVAEQLRQSKLFDEVGTDRQMSGESAVEQLNKMAAKRAAEFGISQADALGQVMSENPALYSRYVAETQQRVK
jgi:hypothetical protein